MSPWLMWAGRLLGWPGPDSLVRGFNSEDSMAQTNLLKPRQIVRLSLSTALIAAARDVTDDVSGTVEMLLVRHVHEARQS